MMSKTRIDAITARWGGKRILDARKSWNDECEDGVIVDLLSDRAAIIAELEKVRRNHLRNQLRRAELAAKTFAHVARQDPAHSTVTPRRLRRAARNRDRWRKVVEAIRVAIEQTGATA